MSNNSQYKFGEVFRLITPTLILIIGYLTNMGICDIKKNIDRLEVGYERRLSCLESRKNER
jgi:fumarate reductase subunit D